jgi:hypothetical protein
MPGGDPHARTVRTNPAIGVRMFGKVIILILAKAISKML